MAEAVIPNAPATPRIRTSVEFAAQGAAQGASPAAIEIRDGNLFYGSKQALHDISMDIPKKRATAFIGPSGCGKSTLLRCLNRMNDLIDNVRITGTFNVRGQDIYAPATDVIEVRRRVGMVFQKSNPLPKSIYENVVYGLRIAGIRDRATLDEAFERSLRGAALWDEVKDRLHESGLRETAARGPSVTAGAHLHQLGRTGGRADFSSTATIEYGRSHRQLLASAGEHPARCRRHGPGPPAVPLDAIPNSKKKAES